MRGWRLQTISERINGLPAIACTRPGPHGNPFTIGGFHKIGSGGAGMSRIECLVPSKADSSYTHITDAQMAVDMHREFLKRYPNYFKRDLLVGHNLACACALDQPCHVDTLIEMLLAE